MLHFTLFAYVIRTKTSWLP